jgi:hypothetical protein
MYENPRDFDIRIGVARGICSRAMRKKAVCYTDPKTSLAASSPVLLLLEE